MPSTGDKTSSIYEKSDHCSCLLHSFSHFTLKNFVITFESYWFWSKLIHTDTHTYTRHTHTYICVCAVFNLILSPTLKLDFRLNFDSYNSKIYQVTSSFWRARFIFLTKSAFRLFDIDTKSCCFSCDQKAKILTFVFT